MERSSNGRDDALRRSSGHIAKSGSVKGPSAENMLERKFIHSVRNVDLQSIKDCIDGGVDVNCRVIPLNNSVLHVLLSEACFGKDCTPHIRECLKVLLKHGVNPNSVNSSKVTPLEIAVDNMVPPEILHLLLDYGATVVSKEGITNESLARKLAAKMPNEFNYLLDKAVKFKEGSTGGRKLVQLDWSHIVYDNKGSREEGVWQETRFLNDILNINGPPTHIILTHPLITAFLKLKGTIYWWNFGMYYCSWIVLTYVLYMVFVWNVYNDVCGYVAVTTTVGPTTTESTIPSTTDGDDSDSPGDSVGGTRCRFRSMQRIIAVFILAMYVLGPLLLELRKLVALGLRPYARQWQNYVTIISSVLIVLTLLPALRWLDRYELTWEYPCAAIGMLVASLSIMVQMTPITFVILYAEMLYKVFCRIMVASIGLAPLFLGFFYGFRILLTRQTIGVFELLTMVVSDVEYEDIMDRDRGILYDMIAYFFFSAFIIVMVIVVLNFLIGLAVSDIQELTVSAKATRFCNMVRSYYIMDAVYGSSQKRTSVIFKKKVDEKEVTSSRFVFEFDPLDPSEDRLPESIKLQLLELARNRCCH